MVEALTEIVRGGHPEWFIINTGRSYEQLEEILKKSEVPEDVIKGLYTVTYHGSELRLGDPDKVIHLASSPQEEDLEFIKEIDKNAINEIRPKVVEILKQNGFETQDAETLATKLNNEPKEKSAIIHYRALVKSAYEKKPNIDQNALGKQIHDVIKDDLQTRCIRHEEHMKPRAEDQPILEPHDEPMALEVRQSGLDKGQGCECLMKELEKIGKKPTRAIFAGDGMLEKNGDSVKARNDYSAAVFMKYPELSGNYANETLHIAPTMQTAKQMGIQGHVIHVHQPQNLNGLNIQELDDERDDEHDISPDPQFDFPDDHPMHPEHGHYGTKIDLVMKSPWQFSNQVAETLLQRVRLSQMDVDIGTSAAGHVR